MPKSRAPGNHTLSLQMSTPHAGPINGKIAQVFVALSYKHANAVLPLVGSKQFLEIRAVIVCLMVYGFKLQASCCVLLRLDSRPCTPHVTQGSADISQGRPRSNHFPNDEVIIFGTKTTALFEALWTRFMTTVHRYINFSKR